MRPTLKFAVSFEKVRLIADLALLYPAKPLIPKFGIKDVDVTRSNASILLKPKSRVIVADPMRKKCFLKTKVYA